MVAPQDFTYRGKLVRVVDGDTVIMLLERDFDFGFKIHVPAQMERDLRLADVNTPEKNSADPDIRQKALKAQAATSSWFLAHPGGNDDWPFTVVTRRGDEYGRYLARVFYAGTTESLNDYLVKYQYAVPFDVGKSGV